MIIIEHLAKGQKSTIAMTREISVARTENRYDIDIPYIFVDGNLEENMFMLEIIQRYLREKEGREISINDLHRELNEQGTFINATMNDGFKIAGSLFQKTIFRRTTVNYEKGVELTNGYFNNGEKIDIDTSGPCTFEYVGDNLTFKK